MFVPELLTASGAVVLDKFGAVAAEPVVLVEEADVLWEDDVVDTAS
jgi:hypothetical protein